MFPFGAERYLIKKIPVGCWVITRETIFLKNAEAFANLLCNIGRGKTNRLIITAYVIIGAIYLSAVKNIGRRIIVWCPARS